MAKEIFKILIFFGKILTKSTGLDFDPEAVQCAKFDIKAFETLFAFLCITILKPIRQNRRVNFQQKL